MEGREQDGTFVTGSDATAPGLARRRPGGAGLRRRRPQVSLDEAALVSPEQDVDVLALDSRKSRIVEMRYFGGMTEKEVAEVLEIAPITVKREWSRARACDQSPASQIKSGRYPPSAKPAPPKSRKTQIAACSSR